ncbi:MAG: hypothetical protein VKP62_04965 [Candidatus Sericytochromatia bacterium]|nr:hypothetical protein [Candidatus Sericytochromatia bacterium]
MTPGMAGSRPSPLSQLVASDGCLALRPSNDPVKGSPLQGAYVGQHLPADWQLLDEKAISLRFRDWERSADWRCASRYYPEAVAIYLALMGRPPLAPPRPTPSPRVTSRS